MKPQVSVIIVNWNTRNLLPLCLETLRTAAHAGAPIAYDVWVVDNASTDDSVEMVRTHFPDVHIIANRTNVQALPRPTIRPWRRPRAISSCC
jgi:GT2 family glycosyltransferase